jgi:hypothetical protein
LHEFSSTENTVSILGDPIPKLEKRPLKDRAIFLKIWILWIMTKKCGPEKESRRVPVNLERIGGTI